MRRAGNKERREERQGKAAERRMGRIRRGQRWGVEDEE
jgi:hypothetical protein